MGTKFTPLLQMMFCYEGDNMLSLSHENQAKIIDAFNPMS